MKPKIFTEAIAHSEVPSESQEIPSTAVKKLPHWRILLSILTVQSTKEIRTLWTYIGLVNVLAYDKNKSYRNNRR